MSAWRRARLLRFRQDSRLALEFDVSEVIALEGDNLLVVQAMRWCSSPAAATRAHARPPP